MAESLYTLMTLDNFDYNLNPMVSDNWGLLQSMIRHIIHMNFRIMSTWSTKDRYSLRKQT